jgi:hypothetical protein
MVGLAPWSNDFANGLWFADTRSARLRTRSSVVGSMLGQPAHDLIWVSFGIDALFFQCHDRPPQICCNGQHWGSCLFFGIVLVSPTAEDQLKVTYPWHHVKVRFHRQGTHSQGTHSQGTHSHGTLNQGTHSQGAHSQGAHSQGAHSQGAHSQGTHSQGTHSQGTHSQGGTQPGMSMILTWLFQSSHGMGSPNRPVEELSSRYCQCSLVVGTETCTT